MYRNAIEYKGVWLAPNSEAYTLYQMKKFAELDKLLKETEIVYQKYNRQEVK